MAINFPSSPTNGQVYTDTTSGMTWVYSTTDTAWSASFNRSNYVSQTFTATAGQTSFTVSGGYLPSLVEVYQNGVLLVNGTDVTVTSGTSVVLTSGATAGDIIQVLGISTFNVASFDASAITSGIIPVTRGGTGQSSIAANNVVLGNGTSAVQTVAPGTNGNVLTSNGTTWTSAALPASGVTSVSAGNGITVSGTTAVTVSQDIYAGTNKVNTSYPIGSYMFVSNTACTNPALTDAVPCWLESGASPRWFVNASAGAAVTGTWRWRGNGIAQRVA